MQKLYLNSLPIPDRLSDSCQPLIQWVLSPEVIFLGYEAGNLSPLIQRLKCAVLDSFLSCVSWRVLEEKVESDLLNLKTNCGKAEAREVT